MALLAEKPTRVVVLDEVGTKTGNKDWTLCFQRVRYERGDGQKHEGYRFIQRTPNGHLRSARGQARIPSLAIARKLMDQADARGWGNFVARDDNDRFEPDGDER
jgi:hypothetical protein